MPTRLALATAGGLLLAQPVFAHHASAVSGAGGAGSLNTILATTLDGRKALPVLTYSTAMGHSFEACPLPSLDIHFSATDRLSRN